MKMRIRRNQVTKKRELAVISQKNEELNHRKASWIEDNKEALFLSALIDTAAGQNKNIMQYDIDGLMSLKSYVKKNTLSKSSFVNMLTDMACVYGLCTTGEGKQSWQESLVFSIENVYVNADTRLRFVFVPFDGIPYSIDNSPLSFLRFLSNTRKIKFETPNDLALAQGLAKYVFDEENVFSYNTFRKFLKRECDIEVKADGTISVVGHKRYCVERLSTNDKFYIDEGQRVCIGRGSKCELRFLGNQQLSRSHAAIKVNGGIVTVTDLGSVNGTFVNGRRLQPHQDGTIQLNQRFMLDAEEVEVKYT